MEIIHSFVNSFLISEHFFGHFLRTFTLKIFFFDAEVIAKIMNYNFVNPPVFPQS